MEQPAELRPAVPVPAPVAGTPAARAHGRRWSVVVICLVVPALLGGLLIWYLQARSSRSESADAPVTVLWADFDDQPLGRVVPARFARVLGGRVSIWPPNYADMSIVDDGSGGRAVRTTLQAGTTLSLPSGQHGAVLSVALPRQYDQACLSYWVRFDARFDWSLGGKLPGLVGVAPGVRPGAPAGGHPTAEGWSGRLMWVGPKAYSWAGPTNMVVSYLYHPGQRSDYGDNIRWNRSFDVGRWHQVKQCFTMNTVGRSDGVLQAWFDGTRVVDDPAFVYRTRSDVHINYLEWDIFRGGNTLEWAGSRTGYIDIDDVRVTVG